MKYRIIVSVQAGIELRLLARWLERERKGYGYLLMDEFDEALTYLEAYPFAQQLHKGSYRQLKIGRFQFYIIYEVIGDSIVHIYKVLHGKQHPGKKLK